MILSFKSRFVPFINYYTKMNTIRKSGRWKKGNLIHFYEGNPRNGGIQFVTGEVLSVRPVVVDPLFGISFPCGNLAVIHIIRPDRKDSFARKEGFDDWEDMKTFFPKRFEGDFIEWGYSFRPINQTEKS